MGKRKEDDLRTARIAVMFTDEERDRLRDLAAANGKTVATEVYDRVRFSLQLPHDFDFNATRAKEQVVVDLRIALEEMGVIPAAPPARLSPSGLSLGPLGRGLGRGLLGQVGNALAAPGISGIPVSYDIAALDKLRDEKLKTLLETSDVVVTDEQYRKLKGSAGDDEAVAVLDELREIVGASFPAVSEITRQPWAVQTRIWQRLFSAFSSCWGIAEILYVRRFAAATNEAIDNATGPLLRIDDEEDYQASKQLAAEKLAEPLTDLRKKLDDSTATLKNWRDRISAGLFALKDKLSADPLASLED
jgi:hypothetical protein